MSVLVGSRYADALFQTGQELGLTDEFDEELLIIKDILNKEEDLLAFLKHPQITVVDKKTVTENIFKDIVSKYMLNFIKLLVDKGRISSINDIYSSYKKLYNSEKGIVEVVVTTTTELDKDREDKLIKALSTKLDKEVRLTKNIDPSILGGIVLDYQGKRIDRSLINQIKTLEKNLTS